MIFEQAKRLILNPNPLEKAQATQSLLHCASSSQFDHGYPVVEISTPGYPSELDLVPPRALKRRGMKTQQGRNQLMHAIAHIEYNAINLALDAVYRFRHQDCQFYRDWLRIAADEARHFLMVNDYLIEHECYYGAYPAHNGLWEMAIQTQDDIVARMALVPRVLEARGLDVTPNMIKRLKSAGDIRATRILETIYIDEIEHVKIGSYWFKTLCRQRGLAPRDTFRELVDQHLHGQLRGPFNVAARLKAGFDAQEMIDLQAQL